jgi:hypothetical protein
MSQLPATADVPLQFVVRYPEQLCTQNADRTLPRQGVQPMVREASDSWYLSEHGVFGQIFSPDVVRMYSFGPQVVIHFLPVSSTYSEPPVHGTHNHCNSSVKKLSWQPGTAAMQTPIDSSLLLQLPAAKPVAVQPAALM